MDLNAVLTVLAAVITVAAVAALIIITRRLRDLRRSEALLSSRTAQVDQRASGLAVADAELARRSSELDRVSEEVRHRLASLDERGQVLDQRAAELDRQVGELEERDRRQQVIRDELEIERERIAGLTQEDARTEIVAEAERTARQRVAAIRRQIEAETLRTAERKAREVVVDALTRVAVEEAGEAVITVVGLPNEETKGRIIGREGRNIRTFEQVTGANLIVDDTPGVVVVSCFDPRRRAVAAAALTELVADGRINPATIETACQKAMADVAAEGEEAAARAVASIGLSDLDPELIEHLATLHFRTSYGQNVLAHMVECAQLAAAMAAELGLNVATAKRAAFLHDIGKAVTPERQGSHAAIGAELARQWGEHADIVNAIAAHHNEVPPKTAEAVLAQVADAISGSRPGARRERLGDYLERMERLEEIAKSHPGIDRVFAIKGGREIRVMVLPETVGDTAAAQLADAIALKIEAELVYPGQITVTVIRESRATATAS